MRTRTLGLMGIIGSPFMAIMLSISGMFNNHQPTSLAGLLSFLYMVGWFCSILGLYRLQAAGNGTGKIILLVQMSLLTVGNLWNIYSIINPLCNTTLFHIADLVGWPFDNIFMLATGTAVIIARQLQGWQRFVPLIVGGWFPITVVLTPAIFGPGTVSLVVTSVYSIVSWSLLGWIVYWNACKATESKEIFVVKTALV